MLGQFQYKKNFRSGQKVLKELDMESSMVDCMEILTSQFKLSAFAICQ